MRDDIMKQKEYDFSSRLFTNLTKLSGHFDIRSKDDEKKIKELQKALSSALAGEDIGDVKNSNFSFENSDLFFNEKILPENILHLRELTSAVKETDAENERVFVREVPVRSSQISGSIPTWGSGASLSKTLGPYLSKDGRQLWFDFYKIEKLIALYLEGENIPAILFNVSLIKRFILNTLPPVIDPATKYKLIPDSVWINSKLLASNSPNGFFTGLKIKGGEISLKNPPKLINDKLTVTGNTIVNVKLDLDQPDINNADDSTPYGIDARNSKINLPKFLSFQFSKSGSSINEITGEVFWNVYGHEARFNWNNDKQPVFNSTLNRILIPFNCSDNNFAINNCESSFNTIDGTSEIKQSSWALTAAQIDVTKPSPASGIGGIAVQTDTGLSANWKGLKGGSINFAQPFILADIGRIGITDLQAGNIYSNHEFKLWKDDQNEHGSTIKLQFTKSFPFIFNTLADGNESLFAHANTNPLVDRPVTVSGQALDIRSKNSILILAVSNTFKIIYLYDDNIIFDNYDPDKPHAPLPKPLSLALNNALFKVSPVNGCLLFGQLADDFIKIKTGILFLTFGMYAYLPTLPDPYAANINRLKFQFRGSSRTESLSGGNQIWLWLVCQTRWEPIDEEHDTVEVSFHFAPLQNQSQPNAASSGLSNQPNEISSQPFVKLFSTENNAGNIPDLSSAVESTSKTRASAATTGGRDIDLDKLWDDTFRLFLDDIFALLDVSSNADQMGVSFASFGRERLAMMRTFEISTSGDAQQANFQFPIQVQGMDVVAHGIFAKAFTVPQISWEPVMNLTSPNDINPTAPYLEPPVGPNYYPNDGGPTRILNNSLQTVPLAPIPLTDFIIDKFENEKGNVTLSLFGLPFGMKAITVLNKDIDPIKPATIQKNSHNFPNNLKGGIQIQFNAGTLSTDVFPLFHGGTLQLNNILNVNGQKTSTGTLGDSVAFIFNQEFVPKLNDLIKSRGVPLTRIDFSGYGASIFSNWFNPEAQFAQTSQAKFDVFVGRTAHEVIQVRSMIYPWGIRVVRTIILYRSGSGYVYRVDTGWKAESDGLYDFSYRLKGHSDFPASKDNTKVFPTQDVFKMHPGIIKGLFNIKNILEVGEKFPLANSVAPNAYYVDENNFVVKNTTGSALNHPATLKMVEFDCDVEIEEAEQGAVNGRVPSKKMRGFVQLAPMGIPISEGALEALHILQGGSIGGSVDCIIDVGKNGQKMRINRIDSNNAKDAGGTNPIFSAAARGNVILPKDGSWSMVMHEYDSGEVSPLPQNVTVPVIRIGQLIANVFTDPENSQKDKYTLKLDTNPDDQLWRVANPTELLRVPTNGTINFGYLQTTDTQKALFLTPAYQKIKNITDSAKLLSKTPPLFADAYRTISSKGIFPNIGNAVTDFGDAIALDSNFAQSTITDAGKNVLELMQINVKDVGGKIEKEGYKLLKQVENLDFPLPNKWSLVDEDYLKIYVEYKTDRKVNNNNKTDAGKLNFDVNSFTNNVEEKWKSKMNNLSMVLDLGPFERLMIIKGNFDSKKGSEASFKGSDSDTTFPAPQIEFSSVLQTVMDILQILQDLQGAKYGDAVKKGLKIAMSNSADSWEYKFEATKEIPVVKFPIPESVYNAPTTPLKLEAYLKIGVYFNAALKVTPEPGKLLPTAGAFLDFGARLSVMCVSLAAATVYAVGQADLGIGADTKVGPNLKLKFGFGVQIVVGLPVVGNVSVLYMVGVEIYIDSTQIAVTASMLFQGHAELLGGIVSITITIEAKGTVKRIGERTDASVQVTFAIEISIFLVINIDFSTSWQENRQIA
jgi:hypothetical protein